MPALLPALVTATAAAERWRALEIALGVAGNLACHAGAHRGLQSCWPAEGAFECRHAAARQAGQTALPSLAGSTSLQHEQQHVVAHARATCLHPCHGGPKSATSCRGPAPARTSRRCASRAAGGGGPARGGAGGGPVGGRRRRAGRGVPLRRRAAAHSWRRTGGATMPGGVVQYKAARSWVGLLRREAPPNHSALLCLPCLGAWRLPETAGPRGCLKGPRSSLKGPRSCLNGWLSCLRAAATAPANHVSSTPPRPASAGGRWCARRRLWVGWCGLWKTL